MWLSPFESVERVLLFVIYFFLSKTGCNYKCSYISFKLFFDVFLDEFTVEYRFLLGGDDPRAP